MVRWGALVLPGPSSCSGGSRAGGKWGPSWRSSLAHTCPSRVLRFKLACPPEPHTRVKVSTKSRSSAALVCCMSLSQTVQSGSLFAVILAKIILNYELLEKQEAVLIPTLRLSGHFDRNSDCISSFCSLFAISDQEQQFYEVRWSGNLLMLRSNLLATCM